MSDQQAAAQTPSRFERHRYRVLALFAQRGFGQVSVRQVATELELTVGSLYHHCDGKQALLFEFIEEHYQAMLGLFARQSGTRPTALMTTVLDRLATLYERSPAHFHLALHERHHLHNDHLHGINHLRVQVGGCLAHMLLATRAHPHHKVLIEPALAVFEQLPLWRADHARHTYYQLAERLLAATVISLQPESFHADVPRALT